MSFIFKFEQITFDMKKKIVFGWMMAIGVVITLNSCDTKPKIEEKPATPVSVLSADSLKIQADAVNDSLDLAWKKMERNDSTILADMKRLLQEVSYTPKHDIIKLKQLEQKLATLQTKLYTKESMADSRAIDNYDSASDSLVSDLAVFASSTPQIEKYTLIKELLNEISVANSAQTVATNRAHYDNWAKEYNKIVIENADGLKKLGEPYASMKVKPLFAIAQ